MRMSWLVRVEEAGIDEAHGPVEPGVLRRQGEVRWLKRIEAIDESHAGAAEIRKEFLRFPFVVIGVMCALVRDVGSAENGGAGEEVIEAPDEEIFEINQVPDVLEDGPCVCFAPAE